jgi:multimeric flavodoxin WrbA
MTKVVAINGSPSMERGNTAILLNAFLKGVKQAGGSVELYYAKQLNIMPCTGELQCWNKTPGQCYIQDDMQMLYPKMREADVLCLATPVYIPLPGEMQNVVNRLVLLMSPALEIRDGRTRVRVRNDVKLSKIVLVATSGWWEKDNLGTVLRIVEELAKDMNIEFAGALLRPHSSQLRDKEKAESVLEAAMQAGLQLVRDGHIAKETLETISRPLTSLEEYMGK